MNIKAIKDIVFFVSPLSDEIVNKNSSKNVPSELETSTFESTEELKQRLPHTKYLSERNYKGLYIVPIFKDRVELKYLPQKTFIDDKAIEFSTNTNFEYFTDVPYDELIDDEVTLAEGTFFRVANEGVKDKEDYNYHIVKDGKIKDIPNYKTLEVMLTERDKTYADVRVIEEGEFNALKEASSYGGASGQAPDPDSLTDPEEKKAAKKAQEDKKNSSGGGGGGGSSSSGDKIEDKSGQWKEEMKDKTSYDTYEDLAETADSAEAIAQDAVDEAQKNIDMAIADAEAAEQQAAQAQSEAEASAAQAALAEAQAQQAIAEAQKAQAEAEAEKARLEAEQNENN